MDIVDVDRLAFPDLAELADRARDTGSHQSRTIDLPIGRLGREPIALAVDAVPLLDGEDRRVGAVGLLLTDMSEHRRLEAVRRDFVANVSHELKTPVGALTLLAEAVQDAADDPDGGRPVRRPHAARGHPAGPAGPRADGAVPGAGRRPDARRRPRSTSRRLLAEAADRARLAAEQASITVDGRAAPTTA